MQVHSVDAGRGLNSTLDVPRRTVGAMKGPYKLKLTKLDYLSAVDSPAQGEGAKALLLKRRVIKRAGADVDVADVKLTAKVAKLNDELGLVFGYAFSTSLDGDASPHVDYQEDAIDPDFLKVAMQFIEGGGPTDVNHDFAKDGKVVFAWPLLPEINKAFGIDAKQLGLAVAVKPTPETYAKFKSGELTGFSIAGSGERTPLAKSLRKHLFMRVLKESVLTSNVDGHQHAIALDDPATYWCDMYQTSYQNMEGAEQGHSHAWTFDAATGAITIAADSGHTHAVDAVVPADVLAAFTKLEAEKDAANAAIAAAPVAIVDDPSDGVPSSVPVEESSGAVIVVNVLASNPASNSTPPKPIRTVKTQPETKPMSTLLKLLPVICAMSVDERTHLGKLGPEDAEAFIGKSTTDRAEIVKSARGVEVYKSERLGRTFYTTDDATMVVMAKDSDATHLELAKSRTRAEQAEFEKRASVELSHFAKGSGISAAILRAVEGIGDEAVRKDAIEALKGANAAMKELATAKGVNPGEDPSVLASDTPVAKFNAARVEFAKAKYKVDAPNDKQVRGATAEFIATEKGADLYSEAYPTRVTG